MKPELTKALENLPLLIKIAEHGLGEWGPAPEQFQTELETLIRYAATAAFVEEGKTRDLLKGYALILDDKIEDMKALRHNFRRDAGLPEKDDDDG